MIIRVYALYMKSRRVLLFLISVILATISVGCWAILSPLPATARPVPTPSLRNGCNSPTTYEQSERLAIAWGGQMTFDATVFVLTLWRTLRVRRLGNRTLLDIFIRDGECCNMFNHLSFCGLPIRMYTYRTLILRRIQVYYTSAL
ncbi:hypothetical protein EDC04DRAFT_2672098 [Pisolithus marmoratus]|nr:hypothetical protein EDC04DRAFT_2672098 [Pisolithus marmoratus]